MNTPMLRIARRLSQGIPTDILSLPYAERRKSRLRARTDSGSEVAISLQRGTTLRDGDLLAAESGEIVLVRAAVEIVSDATSQEPRLLLRAAYRLGNRHVPVQLDVGLLRYQYDRVLDTLLVQLGLRVTTRSAAFEPERGVYAHHDHTVRIEHMTEHKH
jgi:urease accessory protein